MKKHTLKYGSSAIHYSIEYRDRKTLGIQVHPDTHVRVIAPIDSSMDLIVERLRTKAAWILKQQDFFLAFHPKTPPRRYISGETHLYLGRQYRLKIVQSTVEDVKLLSGRIVVRLPDKKDTKRIEQLLKAWYKAKADYHFNILFDQSLKSFPLHQDHNVNLKMRWMSKRWGSCDKNGTIHLNLELIKAPKKCIEYVIVHELCHLKHLNHSRAFYTLLESVYPDWMETKSRLEKLMV